MVTITTQLNEVFVSTLTQMVKMQKREIKYITFGTIIGYMLGKYLCIACYFVLGCA